MKILIAFLILGGAFEANARASAGRQDCARPLTAGEVFFKNFHDRTCYVGGECDENVARLIERIVAAKVDIEDAQVILIPEERMENVRSDALSVFADSDVEGRAGVSAKWNYHVVVRIGGRIYDFDLSNSARPLTTQAYFAHAFPSLAPDRGVYILAAKDFLRYAAKASTWLPQIQREGNQSLLPIYVHRVTLGNLF